MKLDLVDVFGTGAISGNPLAVVRGGKALSGEQMLALTRWLGFSETTFLLPPTDAGADYRVRIFYPAGELPFAGHPTLGSCQAWLAAGGVPRRAGRVVQECGVGRVEIAREAEGLAFAAPPMIRTGVLSAVELAEALRLLNLDAGEVVEAVHASNGPAWQLLRLRSAAAVLAVQPEARAAVGTDLGLVGPYPPGGAADFEVRGFFTSPTGQLLEDPVTGSLNAAIARHFFGAGLAKGSYVAAQGGCVGASGRVECRVDEAGVVWIGGRAVMVAQGAELTF